jgi:general secretion pathway protein G
MYVYMKKKQSGFTLIELLVSISIIAILTALLTVNFIGARQRARDAQRKSNLYNIQSALELYRADNDSYPTTLTATSPYCGEDAGNNAIAFKSASGTIYMAKIPCDPSTGGSYSYSPSPADCDGSSTMCTTYTLFGCLENGEDSEGQSIAATTCPSKKSFTLTNP